MLIAMCVLQGIVNVVALWFLTIIYFEDHMIALMILLFYTPELLFYTYSLYLLFTSSLGNIIVEVIAIIYCGVRIIFFSICCFLLIPGLFTDCWKYGFFNDDC